MTQAEELIQSILGILPNVSWENGVCCCGQDMNNHDDPTSSGHSPVDMGVYAVQQWIDRAEAFIAGGCGGQETRESTSATYPQGAQG